MKVLIREIPPQGLELQERLEPQKLGLTDEEFQNLAAVTIAAKLEKVGTTVLAKVHVESSTPLECGRCLEPITKKIVKNCDFDYEIDKRTEFIDLGEDIRQELVLAVNPIALCKEDCKGLCPGCGVNLNREKCECQRVKMSKRQT